MSALPSAPAAERNRGPILRILESELEAAKRVLEIGSGTGQHAVHFAARMPWLTWQTSDLAASHADIRAWIEHAGLDNVLPPLELDVRDAEIEQAAYDAVFSANTAHIMDLEAVRSMFLLAGSALADGGRFLLYGPFCVDGQFTSDSNRDFDASLKARDSAMGIRDLQALDRFASASGLARRALHDMPANNFLAVWIRTADT